MSELDPQSTGASEATEGGDQPRRVIRLRGLFTGPDGGLHRGVPTWVIGEDDEEPVYREHNTGKIFPRVESPKD